MIKMVKHKHTKHTRLGNLESKARGAKRKKEGQSTTRAAAPAERKESKPEAAPRKELTAAQKLVRERLVAMLNDTRKDIEHEFRGASTNDPAHVIELSDMASDAFEGDLALRIAESETAEASEIERAIEKIDEGTYERCDVCDKTIAAARHEFLPYVTMCINCQELEEIRRSKQGDQFEDLSEGAESSESEPEAEADVGKIASYQEN